jgi:hypothetical protein
MLTSKQINHESNDLPAIIFQTTCFIQVNQQIPNYTAPWNKPSAGKVTGSGFPIQIGKQKYILTNAHVVQYGDFIECRKPNDSHWYEMTIYDIAYELDLALLTSSQSSFWQGYTIPHILESERTVLQGSRVYVSGYPRAGRMPSLTSGIISRIDTAPYLSGCNNLAIQVDAAINSGNSGGPVFNEQGNILGVAFSHILPAQNMCYAIPYFLIYRYLNEIEQHGVFQGICGLELSTQPFTNPSWRKSLLPSGASTCGGIYLRDLNINTTFGKILRSGDIICKIDNYTIDPNGSVLWNEILIPWWHILRMKMVNDQITIHFVHDQEIHTQKITLEASPRALLPIFSKDINLHYYNFAGLMFISLNYWYFSYKNGMMNKDTSVLNPELYHLITYRDEYPTHINQDIVILTTIMNNTYTQGYNMKNIRLCRINDQEIIQLKQVYDICEHPKHIYIKFEFSNKQIVILEWQLALDYTRKQPDYHNFVIFDDDK